MIWPAEKEKIEQSLIDVAVESWRFSRLFGKVVGKLDAGEVGRYVNQIRYFQKKLEESLAAHGFRLVSVEGQTYDMGMAASALNLGDFGCDDVLLVDQMLEPIIMGPNGLRKQGTVMLRCVVLGAASVSGAATECSMSHQRTIKKPVPSFHTSRTPTFTFSSRPCVSPSRSRGCVV